MLAKNTSDTVTLTVAMTPNVFGADHHDDRSTRFPWNPGSRWRLCGHADRDGLPRRADHGGHHRSDEDEADDHVRLPAGRVQGDLTKLLSLFGPAGVGSGSALYLAIQDVTDRPISFDNPSVEYHKVALKHYNRAKSGPPILNSIAASRTQLDEMIRLVRDYDTHVVVMASEHFIPGGTAQCLTPEDSYRAARHFVELLVTQAGRRPDQIIIDPGLAPVGADTYGLVNIGLDAMRLISADPDLAGVHLIVGLSNFAWGTPKGVPLSTNMVHLVLGLSIVTLAFMMVVGELGWEVSHRELHAGGAVFSRTTRSQAERPCKRRSTACCTALSATWPPGMRVAPA